MKWKGRLAVGLAALTAPSAAPAVDGVKLLSQPHTFPITITQPGSYRLKKNIVVTNAGDTAIVVNADDVTIDLNGFSIIGPVVCTGDPVSSCTPSSSGGGITSTHDNITVTNGTIRGVAGRAVRLGEYSVVDGVNITGNGGGVDIFSGKVVNSSVIANLGGINIDLGVARNNVVRSSGEGVSVQYGIVSANHVSGSGGGVGTFRGLATANVASSNAGYGITGDLVSGNVACENTLVGIDANEMLLSNVAVGNSHAGIDAGTAGLINNVAYANSPDLVGGLFTVNSNNVCGGDATCP